MKIPSALLRAAMQCQAKDDTRHFLNGVHIKNKFIEATNGYVAVRMAMDNSCRKDLIVNIKSKIPTSAVKTILVLKGETIAKHYDENEKLISVSVIELIDGNFPDISRFISKEVVATEFIGVNPEFIGLFSKMFKLYMGVGAKITFQGLDKAMRMTSDNKFVNDKYGNPVLIVMPMRLD